jgi:hypothetical protein
MSMSTPQPNGDAGENDVSTMAINREELLELIASQLSQLGYRELAGAVAVAVGVNASFVPSGRLWELASLGKTADEADDDAEGLQLADRDMLDDENDEDALVIDSNVRYEPKMAPSFTCLVTAVHKGSVKSAAFSPDGGSISFKDRRRTICVRSFDAIYLIVLSRPLTVVNSHRQIPRDGLKGLDVQNPGCCQNECLAYRGRGTLRTEDSL